LKVGQKLINDIIFTFFKFFRKEVAVFPETIEILNYLKNKDFKVGVLSDVPTGMPGYLIREDMVHILPLIDYVVTSDECGYRKPNKAGLNLLSSEFGISISKLAFIGDEEKDIITARNAGATSILLNRYKEYRTFGEDIQIRSLHDLKAFINNSK